MKREELIDFLLGELPPVKSCVVQDRLATDAGLAALRDRYGAALHLLREAASAPWPAPRARLRLLKPALAAAAVLAVAVSLFLANGSPLRPRAIYVPDGAHGYLRAEETDAAGNALPVPTVEQAILREGALEVAALGSDRCYPLEPGEAVPADSELKSTADTGVRVDLPQGGVLFLGPVSTVQLRQRKDGQTALRLIVGEACTVAGDTPVHLAVDGTDLLLRQESGAAFLRFSPPEAVCLRGGLKLRYNGGKLFDVPKGERLPAACTNDPRTVPVTDDELGLDWYRDLVYARHRVERIQWERPGVSRPIRVGNRALLYLRLVPKSHGTVLVAFGDKARPFEVRKGAELELRLRFADLGTGPRLTVGPANAVREARIFEAEQR